MHLSRVERFGSCVVLVPIGYRTFFGRLQLKSLSPSVYLVVDSRRCLDPKYAYELILQLSDSCGYSQTRSKGSEMLGCSDRANALNAFSYAHWLLHVPS